MYVSERVQSPTYLSIDLHKETFFPARSKLFELVSEEILRKQCLASALPTIPYSDIPGAIPYGRVLSRLVFLRNLREFQVRFAELIAVVNSEQSLRKAEDFCHRFPRYGTPPKAQDKVRVYICGSIAGWLGSAIVLDIARIFSGFPEVDNDEIEFVMYSPGVFREVAYSQDYLAINARVSFAELVNAEFPDNGSQQRDGVLYQALGVTTDTRFTVKKIRIVSPERTDGDVDSELTMKITGERLAEVMMGSRDDTGGVKPTAYLQSRVILDDLLPFPSLFPYRGRCEDNWCYVRTRPLDAVLPFNVLTLKELIRGFYVARLCGALEITPLEKRSYESLARVRSYRDSDIWTDFPIQTRDPGRVILACGTDVVGLLLETFLAYYISPGGVGDEETLRPYAELREYGKVASLDAASAATEIFERLMLGSDARVTDREFLTLTSDGALDERLQANAQSIRAYLENQQKVLRAVWDFDTESGSAVSGSLPSVPPLSIDIASASHEVFKELIEEVESVQKRMQSKK